MTNFWLLLLFCHFSSPVKHSLKYFFTTSSGIPNFPEYVVAVMVDDILAGYCDTTIKKVEAKQDWVKALFQKEPQHLAFYTQKCVENGPSYFKNIMSTLMQRYNQSGGIHILQRMAGCEWDDETGEIKGFNQYGYDGEDLIAIDLETLTWITPKPQAFTTKLRWDADRPRIKHNEIFLTEVFPGWLKNYVAYGKNTLLRTELPSVSLLQKTPSSPVSCHATGFYPDRATLIWRKDGDELHEDVDHGEILPNHDGTFQMSVDLDLSSVSPDDWRRYDCVFSLSGVEDDIVTRLDKAVILTNWEDPSKNTVVIISAVVVVAVIVIVAMGLIHFICRMKKGIHILQRMNGCEWDDETGEINGFIQYGYDGEDLIAIDLETLTWITPKPQAFTTKLRWDADRPRIKYNELFLTEVFPGWLKKYVAYGKNTLLRTELPSVSLLQKTPSSPVSCHATGFYPDRATLIWRKDGDELHEDVDHGEILPNHDGTFQMSVDLDLSSVSPDDWRRYDCVFSLSGVEDDIVTRLDKAVILTNWEDPSKNTVVIISAVVVVAVIVIVAMGLIHFICRMKKAKCPKNCPDNSSELSENLKPVE